ncbi:MAG: helix-turn-helix transcriptional regulator, partial [Clostridia bacterium]|nr:helix-turn-helix transcriptional regulator [Clostridia bacterium]
MNLIFSNNLKKLRLQKRLTQEQVAEFLGVTSQTVSRWECNTTYPDVMLLPEIAKLYCVTVDDLFNANSSAYKNYAQRLASVYETTRKPEDFIYADSEFKKLIKKGEYSTEDLWTYGTLHHFMMQYCLSKAIDLFDAVIEKGADVNSEVFWKTKTQKMLLLSQIGKSKESITSSLERIKSNSTDNIEWRCLIQAYIFDNDFGNAYKCFTKAIKKFQNDAIIFSLGGDICKELGQYKEALSFWNK